MTDEVTDGAGDFEAAPGSDAGGHPVGLVRIHDLAGRPRGTGFVADDRGTVITGHEAVDGLDRMVLHGPDGRTCRAGAADLTLLPELGLALVRTEGLGVRPLPVAAREAVLPGTYVRLPARGWRQARVLGAGAEVGYTAAGRRHALPATVELAIGTDGRDALGLGGEACGGPVLDAATGAVLAVVGTALRTEHRPASFAVPLRAAAATTPTGPLASLLDRNAATVPAYGAELNLAGALELTATTVGSAVGVGAGVGVGCAGPGTGPGSGSGADPGSGPGYIPRQGRGTGAGAGPVERPRIAGELGAFAAGHRLVLGLVGDPGTGRTTILTTLAADRARGPRPAPTLWLRGADLRGGDASLADAVTRVLAAAGRIVTAAADGTPGAAVSATAERVARLAAAAGRALLVVLDAPEEMPPQLAHRLAPWTGATAGWLRATGVRLVVAARPEYWEGAGALYPPEALHTPDRPARRLPPALPVGDLTPAEAQAARARLGIPDDAVRESDARHPLTLHLLAGIRAAGVTAGRPGRDEVFGAHLDLVVLRVAVRIAASASGSVPVHGPGVRRLAARVAGRVHEAARRCLGPGQGQLDRAAFEELFPWRTGWASAVLTEGLLVPAGPGYRFAHEELSDWLQGGHLDVPTALDTLVHHGPATSGPPVPRHRIGPVLEAVRRLPQPEARIHLTGLVDALNRFAEHPPEPPVPSGPPGDTPGPGGSDSTAGSGSPPRAPGPAAPGWTTCGAGGVARQAAAAGAPRAAGPPAAVGYPWPAGSTGQACAAGASGPSRVAERAGAAGQNRPAESGRPACAAEPSGTGGVAGAADSAGPAGPAGPSRSAGPAWNAGRVWAPESPGPGRAAGPTGAGGGGGTTCGAEPFGADGPSGAGGAAVAGADGAAGVTRTAGLAETAGGVGSAGSGMTGWPLGAVGAVGAVGGTGDAGVAGVVGAAGAAEAAGGVRGAGSGRAVGSGGVGDRGWWASRLLRGVLLRASDAAAQLPVLHALAEHVARVGPGEFGGWFWNRLRLPECDRLDLLRRLLPADHRYLEAAARRLARAPQLVMPLLCTWFTDGRRLRGRPGATVATAAQALLHTHRALAVDDLTEALVDAAHPRADELLAVLAEDEPSALSRAVDRWAHDARPGRRVAAAAYGLATAPHVRTPADRDLLRYAAEALLARPGDVTLHGSALGILLRDPQARARHLADALDCFRDPERGSRLPASALVAALPVLPDPDAVFAALRARADGEVLRALAALTTPGLARRAGDLVRDHLAGHPEDAPHAAAFVDRRLEHGPAAGPVLRPLVLDLLRTAPAPVRAALAGVLAAPGGEASYALRGELAGVLLREEADPAVLGAFLDAVAAGTCLRPEQRTRELLRRTGRQLLRVPGGPEVFEHRTVELVRADPVFGALVARWLAGSPAEAAALLGPGARRTVETLSRAAPDVT
ncbi:serine protease [Streptomyces sp. NBC_00249]|uniref:serine protease n=1 Tax=Streptomyces sp. NBC_00249 TaxID=2975690 RepID=UPI00224E24A5|nr:serine protease [Streptomyces sp. NBC_00249]MCX5194020.1 serine protease [Streptomyces sp. NBC_00249]